MALTDDQGRELAAIDPLTVDEIALRIFCAMISIAGAKIDLWPQLGRKQMETAFAMADTFEALRAERTKGSE